MNILLRLFYKAENAERPCQFSFHQFGKMPPLTFKGETDNGSSYLDLDIEKSQQIIEYLNDLIDAEKAKK